MSISEAHTPGVGIDEATRTRDVRGAERPMGIWPAGGGIWMVGTGSEDYSEHAVDLHEKRCTCSDWRYRGPVGSGEISRCYHIARVLLALGALEVPIEADVDASLRSQRERWTGHDVSGGRSR